MDLRRVRALVNHVCVMRLRPLLTLALAVLLVGAVAPGADAKLRCSSGKTEFKQGAVRLFYVARSDTYYVCSARLRRPAKIYEADSSVQPPAGVERFGRHLTFWMTAIGGAGSGTDYCWVDLVTGATRCAGFDDELAMADDAAVRADGAMVLLLQPVESEPGVLLFFRNGKQRFGRPVALGRIGVAGKLSAFGLTGTAVTWTAPDGTKGELPLTARCPKTTCEIAGRTDEIDVGAGD